MRTISLVLMLCMAVVLCGCASSGYNNKVQTGPMVAGAGEKAGYYFEIEKNLIGAKIKGHVTTEGTFGAERIVVNTSATQKAIEIEKPILQPAKNVELTDAATRQMAEGIAVLSKEFTALQKQYGENAVGILTALGSLATAIEDGLPANQLRLIANNLVNAYADVQKAKLAASTQSASTQASTTQASASTE